MFYDIDIVPFVDEPFLPSLLKVWDLASFWAKNKS
jgi:hypothetical protein